MPHCSRRTRTRQIEMLRRQFGQGEGMAFAEVLPAARIEEALAAEGVCWREKVYTPVLTLWAMELPHAGLSMR